MIPMSRPSLFLIDATKEDLTEIDEQDRMRSL
jgi:hypothetical protein